jgi:hypothetical protein
MDDFKKKVALGLIFIAIFLVVSLIPIILVASSNKETTTKSTTPQISINPPKTTKIPYKPDLISEEEKSRINCFLEEESRFENLTEYKCISRGCVYNDSKYDRVPSCYFDRERTGYTLEKSTRVDETYSIYKLRRKADAMGPFSGDISALKVSVIYLGEKIINVKVI